MATGPTDRVQSWHPEEVVNTYLIDDETVYEFASPDWKIVLLDQAPMAAVGFVVAVVAFSVSIPVLGLIVAVVLAATILWKALDSWYTRYVLTDFRVMKASGVLDRNVEFIPWRQVTNVSLRRSFWQRAVGASTIKIDSANEDSNFRSMTDVRNPRAFFETLQEVMSAYSGAVEVEGLGQIDIPRHGQGSAGRRSRAWLASKIIPRRPR